MPNHTATSQRQPRPARRALIALVLASTAVLAPTPQAQAVNQRDIAKAEEEFARRVEAVEASFARLTEELEETFGARIEKIEKEFGATVQKAETDRRRSKQHLDRARTLHGKLNELKADIRKLRTATKPFLGTETETKTPDTKPQEQHRR